MINKHSDFKKKLHYRIDNFFSQGGLSIFLVLFLFFILIFLLMGSGRIIVNLLQPDQQDPGISAISNQLWQVLLQITDFGGMLEDSESSFPNKIFRILNSISGLILFSCLLAYITTLFKGKVEQSRKDKNIVLGKNHTVILGFNNSALEITKELIEANPSERDSFIVVLANVEKKVMDDFFSDTLSNRQTTRIITRNGSTSYPLSLKRVQIENAKAVIILNSALPSDGEDVKHQADYQVLKSILAIVSSSQPEKVPPIVAKLYLRLNRRLAEDTSPGNVWTIDEEMILAKILVQTSHSQGLSLVYFNMVGSSGNKIYFSPVPLRLCSLTFGEIQFYFKQSIPLGIRDAKNEIHLNPKSTYKLNEGDELIILAADDSAIKYYEQPLFKPKNVRLSQRGKRVQSEKNLIVGWSRKTPILINEYGAYLSPGSTIRVVVKRATDLVRKRITLLAKKHRHVKIKLSQVDVRSPSFPQNLHPDRYDNVIILAGEGPNMESIDSETISTLLRIRTLFKEIERETNAPVGTQLITEVMDSANNGIIQETGVRDVLISDQFVSKIMAHVSAEPDVKRVYDELFSKKGSGIYLKSADMYLEELPTTTTFTDLMFAAQQKYEVAFGIKFKAGTIDPSLNHGLQLLPDKDELFLITEEDQLIVLAEDET